MDRKKRKLPKVALAQMMSMAEWASKDAKDRTSQEIFKLHLRLMDKYSDYFFSEPWPKKFDYKRITTLLVRTWILSMKMRMNMRIGF